MICDCCGEVLRRQNNYECVTCYRRNQERRFAHFERELDADVLKRVLADWLDCWDTPDEWMRCRNNAKIALGRAADPTEYIWPDNKGMSHLSRGQS